MPVQILELGENLDAVIAPQAIWRKHLVPSYRQQVDELHSAGNVLSIHVDGTVRPLLEHPMDCSWDSIGAATPVLQRHVSLEELKDAPGT